MKLSPKLKLFLKIFLPVALGVGVVIWLFGREFNLNAIKSVTVGETTLTGLSIAVMLFIARNFGLAWRYRILTESRLGWKSSIKVTMLCNFTSCITPTSAGGSAIGMIFMGREGIEMGRATAVTFITLLLDQLFLVLFCPLLILVLSNTQLFGFTEDVAATNDLRAIFWIMYAFICLLAVVFYLGIFRIPHIIANLLVRIFSMPLLRRWKRKVVELGDNLVETSIEFKRKPFKWWILPTISTLLTWLSRLLIVNALFFAFVPEANQATVLGRQFVVWTLLLYMPTPGGSGVSEWLFKTYYSDLIVGPVLMILAITWRIFTYYIYLLVGFCMIPTFLNLEKDMDKSDKK